MTIVLTDIYEDGTEVVSHGMNAVTLEGVVLPNEHPLQLGAKWIESLGQWVLFDPEEESV